MLRIITPVRPRPAKLSELPSGRVGIVAAPETGLVLIGELARAGDPGGDSVRSICLANSDRGGARMRLRDLS